MYRRYTPNVAIGGVSSSDYTQGHAADIVAPGYGTPYEVAKALAPLVSVLGIGQLILEGVKGKQWVHVSTRVPEKVANRASGADRRDVHTPVGSRWWGFFLVSA